MEHLLIPYATESSLPARSVICFAPHPDDEVFGCGGALARHSDLGVPVRVVILTDGAFGVHDAAEKAAVSGTRATESLAAAMLLGYPAPEFWNLPDRGVEYSESLVDRLSAAILASGADLVYAPSLHELHPDHRALAMATLEAVRRLGDGTRVAMYEVSAPLRPNTLVDIGALTGRKQEAMRCFKSQLTRQRYDDQISALNRYRSYTLPAATTAAEAFEVVDGAAIAKDYLALFVPEYVRMHRRGIPAAAARDLPLVSVIVRSMNRSTLGRALDSLALQTYANVEVVVVNASGGGHGAIGEHCGRHALRLVESCDADDRPMALRRTQAGNLGLRSARGDYLLFLDDDDWLAPDHLAKLVRGIRERPGSLAVHTGIACVDAEGNPGGPVFEVPYDPMLQMFCNHLPIHAVLFSRRLLDDGCAMDESLDLFEDWDFWLQVGRYTDIPLMPGVSGFYRIHDSSGVRGEEMIDSAAYATIYRKWRTLWPDAHLLAAMHRLKEFHTLEAGLAEAVRKQTETATAARAEIAKREQQIAERDQRLALADATIADQNELVATLHGTIAAIHASTSWRLSLPIRWIGGRLPIFARLHRLLRRGANAVARRGGYAASLRAALRALRSTRPAEMPQASCAATATTRFEKICGGLAVNGRGVEIGPSYNPVLPKSKGYDVIVVDHADAETLRAKYTNWDVDTAAIEEVDVVWAGGSFGDALSGHPPFDFIVASHVIEHLPDPIRFLQDCEKKLARDGRLSLVVPDKRFCFDYYRQLTTTGEWVEAYLEKHLHHPPRKHFDHHAYATLRCGTLAWGQGSHGEITLQGHSLATALEQARLAHGGEQYMDIHGWQFTPESFRLILDELRELGLITLTPILEYPTAGFEFFVTLQPASVGGAPVSPSERDSLIAKSHTPSS